MRRFIIIVLLALAAWHGYGKYQSRHAGSLIAETPTDVPKAVSSPAVQSSVETAPLFRCDGRTHCSQMTSCAEATFFLKNCPGVKMDGNNDGRPCEKQWCKP